MANRIEGVKKKNKGDIKNILLQNPNSRMFSLFGPTHWVYLYEFGKKRYDSTKILLKQEKIALKYNEKIARIENNDKRIQKLLKKKQHKIDKFNKILKEGNRWMRWGEPLAIYDSVQTHETVLNISNFMINQGYFTNTVQYEKKIYGKKSNKIAVTYHISPGFQFQCDSLEYHFEDENIKNFILENTDPDVLKGKSLLQSRLNQERERVYELMVNQGYYDFSKDYVVFELDTTILGPKKVRVKEIILNPPDRDSHQKTKIDSVVFVTDAGLNIKKKYPNQIYENTTFTYGRFRYNPKILAIHNDIIPNQWYSRQRVLKTQKQLSSLDIFKYTNVKFDSIDGRFVGHIFTSPTDKFSTSTEVGLSVSQALPGPFASFNIKNRNLFNQLELIELSTQFRLEGLGSVRSSANTYSSLLFGTTLSVTFPQFLTPLGIINRWGNSYSNPNTRFSLSYRFEDRFNEYNRTTINTDISYLWNNKNKNFSFSPFKLSVVDAKMTSSFKDFLDNLTEGENSYSNSFRSSLIHSASFQVNINNDYNSKKKQSRFIHFFFETGGNILSLFKNKPYEKQLEYFQFLKTSIDFRQKFHFFNDNFLVLRLNIGVANPYGNNKSLPYEKYFFGGGSNNIRAWKPRRLGPGSFGIINADGVVNYNREQPGDVLIQSNIEYRHSLDRIFDLAFFVDIGNIWLLNSETIDAKLDPEQDDGKFRFSEFYKEFAIGVGYGIRFDLTFLIFRLDIGYKLIDPAQPPNKRWVGNQHKFFESNKNFPWFAVKIFKTATFNLGVGFPF